LTVHCGNLPAIRTYLGAGFRVEGILRDGFTLNGNRVDAYLMSVLATRT
jgi:RimJ/RimL family protein N-acetyltransferase